MAKKRKYETVVDGEWFSILWRGWKNQCCDCGKVHEFNFRINEKNRLECQVINDHRATAAVRRAFRFPKEEDD